MLTGSLRTLHSFPLRNNSLLSWRLILDKLNVRDLALGQGRNYEEESDNEEGNHYRKMEYIRTARCLRHFNDKVRIYAAASGSSVIVCIANGITHESHEETEQYKRKRAT